MLFRERPSIGANTLERCQAGSVVVGMVPQKGLGFLYSQQFKGTEARERTVKSSNEWKWAAGGLTNRIVDSEM